MVMTGDDMDVDTGRALCEWPISWEMCANQNVMTDEGCSAFFLVAGGMQRGMWPRARGEQAGGGEDLAVRAPVFQIRRDTSTCAREEAGDAGDKRRLEVASRASEESFPALSLRLNSPFARWLGPARFEMAAR